MGGPEPEAPNRPRTDRCGAVDVVVSPSAASPDAFRLVRPGTASGPRSPRTRRMFLPPTPEPGTSVGLATLRSGSVVPPSHYTGMTAEGASEGRRRRPGRGARNTKSRPGREGPGRLLNDRHESVSTGRQAMIGSSVRRRSGRPTRSRPARSRTRPARLRPACSEAKRTGSSWLPGCCRRRLRRRQRRPASTPAGCA
jgi:hypothetical protein